MKNTVQKKLILEAVEKACHPTAEEVYNLLKENGEIGIATVYRNLNRFVEKGMVKKIPIPGGSDRFDCTLTDHCHSICTCCGELFDAQFKGEALLQSFKTETGFEAEGCSVIIYGKCKKCREGSDGHKCTT